MSSRTVWVTGIGAVSPGGWTADETWKAVVAGRSLGRPIERFDISGAATRVAATVPGRERSLPPDESLALEFGLVAAREAVASAGLQDGDVEFALIGNHGDRRVPVGEDDALILRVDALTEAVARSVGARRWTASHGACAAGSLAIGFGGEYVRSGAADVVLAGAADSLLNGYDFFQFCNLHGMTERDCAPEEASCPFDQRRDGYLLSEGAGFFVLESAEHAMARGAEPLAVLEGFGSSQNAHHYVALPPDASGPTFAIEAALRSAELDPEDVGYVNAHGTSTQLNDKVETLALKHVFGDHAYRVPVSSTKSMLGHLIGASGAVELVIGVLALQRGALPPTINYESPDPDCDLDYIPNQARERRVEHVLSNSFGFGGQNVSLVVSRFKG